MTRAQNYCKDLENEAKRTKDKHEKQMTELTLKLNEMEEIYGQAVRERNQLADKERILLNYSRLSIRLNPRTFWFFLFYL